MGARRDDGARIGWLQVMLGLVVLLSGSVFSVWLGYRQPRLLAFDALQPPPASGLYLPEPWQWDATGFRWSAPQVRLDLPNPGGNLIMRLQVAGGVRDPQVALRGPLTLDLALSSTPRTLHLLLPPQSGEQVPLTLQVEPLRLPGEPRELGVQLGAIQLEGGGQAPSQVVLAMLATSLALALAGRRMVQPLVHPRPPPGLRLSEIGAIVGLTLGLLAALLARHQVVRWPLGLLIPFLASLAVGLLILAPGPILLRAAWQHWQDAPGTGSIRPWLLAGILLVPYLTLALWNHLQVHPGLAFDLAIYLDAGARIAQGESPYPLFALYGIGVAFVYPPASLPVFAALAHLDPHLVAWAWIGTNALASALALLGVGLLLPQPRSRLVWIMLLGVGMLAGPQLEGLAIGQINSLMLLGLVLFGLGLRYRAMAGSGDVALAAAILIKLTPAILLFLPLVRGDWPRLLRVGLALMILSLPSLIWFGPGLWLEFAQLVPELLRGAPRNPYNQALVGVLSSLTTEGSWAEQVAGLLGRLASLGLLLSWLGVAWHLRHRPDALVFGYGLTVVTMASSLIWYHHLIFLSLPLAWLGLATDQRGRLLALLALALIQSTRWLEALLGWFAWPATLAMLLILGGMLWALRLVPADHQ
ncbi:MAG: glycosyltransferase family 87 protein [Oscillochloridaceae bacterium umkhey_bin13]